MWKMTEEDSIGKCISIFFWSMCLDRKSMSEDEVGKERYGKWWLAIEKDWQKSFSMIWSDGCN